MKKLHLIASVFCLCVESIYSDLTVFREELRYTYYHHNLRKTPSSQLLCVSDNPRDAVIWNNHLEWSSDSESHDYKSSAELSNYAVENSDNVQCEFNIDFPDCFSAWTQNGSDWKSISSFDAPMGPVYDKRWEHFSEYFKLDPSHVGYSPIKTTGVDNSSYFVFHHNDALVVSIRGSANAQFLICKSRDIYRDFCYWLIIGGWHNTITAIRKCDNGIPLGVPNPGSNCSILRASVAKHFPLSAFEWKTFIITWEAKMNKIRTIKLFDPNELILSYTDSDNLSLTDENQIYHVFYGNPDRTIPMLFRFHEYNYILTTQIEAKITSPPLTFDHFHEICFDMLLGLCLDCELIINLIDGNATKQITKIISSSSDYQNLKHGLPMWQYARFNASNIDQFSSPITLEIITKLNKTDDSVGGHWALTHFEKCLPQGTVKRLSMTAVSQKRYRDSIYNRDSYYWWPNVTCQQFSYNHQEASVVSSVSEISNSRLNFNDNDFKLCPALKIGPYCATVCSQYFNNNCDSVVMCNQRGCFCSQGHTGARCGSPCEHGWYGFGCMKSCSNCVFNRCDSYDGKCEGQCVETPNRFYIPPYCNIEIESPIAPIINSLNETCVELFVPEGNKYENVFLIYIFEIKSWVGQSEIKISIENVININNTETKVYSEVFSNLTAGTEYSMQTLVTIHYAETKYKHMESEWKNFTTLCNWDKNFEIEFSERSILINRIVEQTIYPCPDQWYLVNLSMIFSKSNKSFPVNTKNVAPRFPMLFSNLEPSTNYSVCIHSKYNEFNFCQNISTFEAEPSEVGYLRAESISSKQAVIKWYPPIYKNGILLGYNLTLRVLFYKSCWFRHIDTPVDLMTSKSFYANHTESYKIEYVMSDLVPYVMYEVTVHAYNSKSGLESKINFTTDELEIPTEVFDDLKFEKNVIKWQKPADCTTVTGAILSARLFLIGLSENVKNFSFQVDSTSSFKIDLTEVKNIYGAEKYRCRVHVLHYPKRIHNETAYAEISFVTDPRPPPKVEKLEIVEINESEQTIMLRWQKPTPPINGEIIYYAIRFSGKNIETTDIAYVYPNETCRLWKNLLCTVIKQPFGTRDFIEVRAYNKDVNKAGDVNVVEYRYHERAPSPPEILSIDELEEGIVDVRWAHPSVTGGPLKSFVINVKILSSRLKNMKTNFEKSFQTINIPISTYETNYSTNLNLLPSTLFIISIQGVTKSQYGLKSSVNIETSSKFAFEFEPRIIINGERSTVNVAIPVITNNTIDSVLYIIVKGDSICNHATIFDSNISNDFEIEYEESAWLAASFLALKKENHIFTIGDGQSYNGHINCPLHESVSYIIILIVRDSGTKSNSNHTIIWKSHVFQLEVSFKYLHIIWVIPITILLLIIVGSIYYYCYIRKRNAIRLAMKSEPFSMHLTNKKINEYVVQKDVLFPEMADQQELISLNSANSIEEINPLYGLEVSNENSLN